MHKLACETLGSERAAKPADRDGGTQDARRSRRLPNQSRIHGRLPPDRLDCAFHFFVELRPTHALSLFHEFS
jgi:hypothetical protein